MDQAQAGSTITARRIGGTLAVVMSALLLPPFVALAVAPALLFLTPVALIALPFVVPAFVSGWRSARADDQRRAARHAAGAGWPALMCAHSSEVASSRALTGEVRR